MCPALQASLQENERDSYATLVLSDLSLYYFYDSLTYVVINAMRERSDFFPCTLMHAHKHTRNYIKNVVDK